MSDIESLRAVYAQKLDGEQNRFQVWEKGGAIGDSVTPATYSGPYRLWMTGVLREFLDEADAPALLSLGCGNAMIEAGLAADGYRVLGVDALEEAVTLASAKGVDAVCADVLTWTPPATDWTVIYSDGLLPHLHDPVQGVRHILERLRSWLPESGGVLVLSIDGPRTDSDVEIAPEVPELVWLSGPYLKAQAEAADFSDVRCTSFTYERPLSGPRDRVIVTARKTPRKARDSPDSPG